MIPSSVKAIKLSILVVVASAFFIVAISPRQTSVSASSKDPIEEISTYKTWTKLTPEPIEGESLKTLANLSIASTDAGG